jgi:LacI family transcriptional regulator
LARHIGVGQKTVSRVFGAPGYVSEAMREKVLAAARGLGYRPNNSARAMRTGRFNNVLLLKSAYRVVSYLPDLLLDGIQDTLARHNFTFTLAKFTDEELTRKDFVPKTLRELVADGFLVNYDTNFPQRMVNLIQAHPTPAVWINSKQNADCVYPNDFQAGRLATEHLLRLGHRRIAYLDFYIRHGTVCHYSRTERLEGYRAAMREAGQAEILVTPEQPVPDPEKPDVAARIMAGAERPTGAVSYSEQEALALMYGAATQYGLRVPRDLSIVTVGMGEFHLGVPLTFVDNPMRQVGCAAVEMLLKKLEHPDQPQPPQAVEFTLVEGGSCAPLR